MTYFEIVENPLKVKEARVDQYGRVNIGKELSGKRVRVIVEEVMNDGEQV